MITIESYQTEASAFLSKRRRALLVAPASSGKTLMLASALCQVVMKKQRDKKVIVGWIANTIEQVSQARMALDKFPQMMPFISARIACAAANNDWSNCDILIVDEVHHALSESWHNQIQTCKGAIWGMTATPKTGNPERDAALLLFFNNEVHTVSREAASSRLSKARVIMLDDTDPNLKEAIDSEIERLMIIRRKQMPKWIPDGQIYRIVSWQACINVGIVNNKARTQAAINAALRHNESGHVLALVNQVEHGKTIACKIPLARMCNSKMGIVKRRDALRDFSIGATRCLVATQIFDEGADLPIADTLVLVSAGRSKAKTEQRTGRVLRVFAGKQGALIYDFSDKFIHPLMAKHAKVRMALYRELGYMIEGELSETKT